jgi:hypothetical protein
LDIITANHRRSLEARGEHPGGNEMRRLAGRPRAKERVAQIGRRNQAPVITTASKRSVTTSSRSPVGSRQLSILRCPLLSIPSFSETATRDRRLRGFPRAAQIAEAQKLAREWKPK